MSEVVRISDAWLKLNRYGKLNAYHFYLKRAKDTGVLKSDTTKDGLRTEIYTVNGKDIAFCSRVQA